MSLNINCDRCGKELNVPGGLLFSPPIDTTITEKFHLCKSCYSVVLDVILKFDQG